MTFDEILAQVLDQQLTSGGDTGGNTVETNVSAM